MQIFLQNRSVWLDNMSRQDLSKPVKTDMLNLLSGDSQVVSLPAGLLIAVSPFLKSVLTPSCPCSSVVTTISLPSIRGVALKLLTQVLVGGTTKPLANESLKTVVEEVQDALDILQTGIVLKLSFAGKILHRSDQAPEVDIDIKEDLGSDSVVAIETSDSDTSGKSCLVSDTFNSSETSTSQASQTGFSTDFSFKEQQRDFKCNLNHLKTLKKNQDVSLNIKPSEQDVKFVIGFDFHRSVIFDANPQSMIKRKIMKFCSLAKINKDDYKFEVDGKQVNGEKTANQFAGKFIEVKNLIEP